MINLNLTPPIISRIHGSELSSQTFAQHYQQPGIPVIIDGLLGENVDWNLAYLSEHLNHHLFLIRCYGQKRYQQDKRSWSNIGSGADVVQMPFDEYAKCLISRQAHAQDMYLAKCAIGNTPLSESAQIKSMSNQLPFQRAMSDWNLWVGPEGHQEALHYDPMDGTLVQLHGEKKVVLFPPSQSANLYPFPISTHLFHGLRLRCWFSQVTLTQADFDTFPNFQKALPHRIELTLKPGEILYIPAGWWHEVTTIGPEMACSVNRFWSVYPFSRAVLSWQRWRTYLGSVTAIPYTMASLFRALFSTQPRKNLIKILRLI